MARFNALSKSFVLPILFDIFGISVGLALLFYAFGDKSWILTRPYFQHVIYFTLLQALSAAFLAVCFSLLLVTVLKKCSTSFVGKVFQYFLYFPFFLPSLIGCLGLILIFGQNGWISKCFHLLHLPYSNFIYGIFGIIVAHLFYYIPFTLRQFSEKLSQCPSEYERLTDSLIKNPFSRFRILQWPYLKNEIIPAFILTSLYCFRSFTTVMIFGGKPGNTTLEVALFQALNFEMDWSIASQIGLIQILFNSALFGFSGKWKKRAALASSGLNYVYPYRKNLFEKVIFGLFTLFFLFPILALSWKGIYNTSFIQVIVDEEFWVALYNSLRIGLLTSLFGLILVASFVYGKYVASSRGNKRLEVFAAELPVHLTMILSPLIIGTVLYILFSEWLENQSLLLIILSLMNAVAFLPSVYRVLSPAFLGIRERFDPLCATLGITGWSRWRWIDWIGVKSAAGYALSICLIFSLGDARSILFFNQSHFPTLIMLIYQKMRHYQFHEAASISVWLIIFSITIYVLLQKIFGVHKKGT